MFFQVPFVVGDLFCAITELKRVPLSLLVRPLVCHGEEKEGESQAKTVAE